MSRPFRASLIALALLAALPASAMNVDDAYGHPQAFQSGKRPKKPSSMSLEGYSRTKKDEPIFTFGDFDDELGDLPLARHHIVPQTELQFLFSYAERYPEEKEGGKKEQLRTALEQFALNGGSSRAALVWAPCNLFLGPDNGHRTDDPGSGTETKRPASFDKERWEGLQALHLALKGLEGLSEENRLEREQGLLDALSKVKVACNPPSPDKVHAVHEDDWDCGLYARTTAKSGPAQVVACGLK